jgi:bifunctional non-homologous end joining protein LigD
LPDGGLRRSTVKTPIAVGADEVDALYRVALEWRIEGLVAKRLGSPYEPGRRSRSWRKMKWPWARDVVAFKTHLTERFPPRLTA